ncbi:hypothetical protein EYF80_049013 [Liparis tanakae]|uniref:Uncharacterized protein n=1 Tax=Liparis tanakae TaxID=230148 RepID=A0A4Z2FKL5_9TELE|nr:hypothetical protein EYF80_049013 [Liparis tanakae]
MSSDTGVRRMSPKVHDAIPSSHLDDGLASDHLQDLAAPLGAVRQGQLKCSSPPAWHATAVWVTLQPVQLPRPFVRRDVNWS